MLINYLGMRSLGRRGLSLSQVSGVSALKLEKMGDPAFIPIPIRSSKVIDCNQGG